MLICVLGRQPALGYAELEALVGPQSIQPFGSNYAIIKVDSTSLSQSELGSVIKIGEVIRTIPTSRWDKVFFISRNLIVRHLKENQSHKLKFGLSAYGLTVSPKQVAGLSFAIRKNLQAKGHTVRSVIGKDLALNSASVIHNGLNGDSGSEFLLVSDSKQTHIARTVSVQDIESYSKRDYERPKRDMKVGMLPPKLAQIMLNLAKASPGQTVLDPFCGTGVVLMEAALKHSKIQGCDVNQKMVDYTKANLEWLSKEYHLDVDTGQIICADATKHRWKKEIDCVVSETYLGPQSSYLNEESLRKAVRDCDILVRKFLVNLRSQLKANFRCCIAVPTWSYSKGLVHLPVVSQLEKMGYSRVRFKHASSDQLVYRRQNQIVARELLVLTSGS